MSSAKDLVLQALPDIFGWQSDPTNMSPLRVVRSRPTMALEDLLGMCQIAKEERDENRLPYRAAQVLAYYKRIRIPHKVGRDMLDSEEVFALCVEGKWEEIRAWIDDVYEVAGGQIYLRDERRILSDTGYQIDFLKDFFHQDLQSELQDITQVRSETAQRWLEGGRPSWSHRNQILLLSRTFYALRHASGMNNPSALLWYSSGSPSPKDLLCRYSGYSLEPDLEGVLRDIGLPRSSGIQI